MHLLNHWPRQLHTLQVHSPRGVEGMASCDIGSRLNQIFLVNAYPPKPLDIASSNFASALALAVAFVLSEYFFM